MTSRLGRRESFAAPLAVLLAAAAGRSQAVYVNVRSGDDRAFGETPATAVQTITRALEVASFDPTMPWTILVGGATDGEGTVLPYDDDPSSCPPSMVCFPLPILPGVSLAWDVTNSDVVLLGPDFEEFAVVRPLVRSSLGPATLVECAPPPGATAASLSMLERFDPSWGTATVAGLAFEEGSPAISIRDGGPYGSVSVLLRDLTIREGQPCVEATATRFGASVETGSCQFELFPPAPRVTKPERSLLVVRAAGEGEVRVTIQDCTFRADPSMGLEGMARFDSDREGLIGAEVRNCRLGSPPPR